MATAPAARILQLLDLLQRRPLTTGREIAGELGIDRRTVRRYVGVLAELGIPVEGERGVGGGYRLRPGFRLPPLMLDDDEAVAVALGLAAAQRQGLAAAEDALAKIRRVLPHALRRRVEALESTLAVSAPAASGSPVAGRHVLALADAIRRRRRVQVRYRSFAGELTERELSPHGLVVHAGRWYLAAHDHLRESRRTFRVDRFLELSPREAAAVAAPDAFDPAAHVASSIARVPYRWTVEVVLDLPVELASGRLPPTLAELEDAGGRTRALLRADSLDWAASVLGGLECEFEIVRPDELRASVERLARRLARIAGRDRDPHGARPT
jgi:predicted DNA-binding transcriptional regulator YafY